MIKFDVSTDVLELEPAETSSVKLTLTNQSPIIDFFTLVMEPVISPEADALDPAWVSFDKPTVNLRPIPAGKSPTDGESQQTIEMTLKLPKDIPAGTYAGRIKVQARSGQGNSTTHLFNLVVAEVENYSLVLDPPDRESRRRAEIYRIKLANDGNAPRLYSLYAEDRDDSCRFELQPNEIMLEQGQDANITLKAKPKQRNWASPPKDYQFKVKIEGMTKMVDGRFLQKCALPLALWFKRRWLRLVIFFLVLFALLTAAFIFFLLPVLNAPRPVACAPNSGRTFNIVGNDVRTQIFIGERGSTTTTEQPVVEESADILPGVFASLVSISPDGRRLAYVTADNMALDNAKIWAVDLTTRTKSQLALVPKGLWPTAPVWSADGEWLVYPRLRSAATAAPATTTPAAGASQNVVLGATPTPTPPPAAANALKPDALDLWIVRSGSPTEILVGADKLDRFDVGMFYKTNNRSQEVMCWVSDNASLVIRTDQNKAITANGQTRVFLDKHTEKLAGPSIAPLFTTPPNFKVSLSQPLEQYVAQRYGLQNLGLGVGGQGSGPEALANSPQSSAIGTGNSVLSPSRAPLGACATEAPYSQLDPRWGDRLLKVGTTARVGDTGCALTAASILLNQLGNSGVTPSSVAECLGEQNTSPLFDNGWKLLGQQCGGSLSEVARNEFSWGGLDGQLGKGPAIVGLLGGQTGVHFVVVTSGGDGKAANYSVTDPWDGSTWKNLEYYLTKGYRLKWLITYNSDGGQICGGSSADPNPTISNNVTIDLETAIQDGGLYRDDALPFQYTVNGTAISSTAKIKNNVPLNPFNRSNSIPPEVSANTPFTFREEGSYSVVVEAKAAIQSATEATTTAAATATTAPNANAVNVPTVSRTLKFVIDRTAPTVELRLNGRTISPTDPQPVKLPGPLTISFRARDELSGIARIVYNLNGRGDQLFNSDTTNQILTLQVPNTYTLEYFAVDGAGNSTERLRVTVEIPNPNGSKVPVTTTIPPITTTLPGAVTTTPAPKAPQTTRPAAVVTTAKPVTTQPPVTTTPPVVITTPPPINTTEAVSTTVAIPVPVLAVSPENMTFVAGATTQTLTIKNNGTIPFTWNVNLGTSNSLIQASQLASVAPINAGQSISLTITLLAPNQTTSNINASFSVVAGGTASKTVNVTINPQPLPTGVLSFNPVLSGGVLLDSNTILLTVNNVAGAAKAKRASLTATYRPSLSTTAAVDTALTPANGITPDGNGNFAFVWSTTAIPPQSGIILKGKVCSSTDESACSDVTAITGLNIPMSAALTIGGVEPSASTLITSSTILNFQQTPLQAQGNRGRFISLDFTVSGTVTPITSSVAITDSLSFVWDTSGLVPGTAFSLSGRICTATPESAGICVPLVNSTGGSSFANLTTSMVGTINFFKANATLDPITLTNGLTLPLVMTVTASNVTTNTNHVNIRALFFNPAGSTTINTILLRLDRPTPLTPALWTKTGGLDITSIPAQSTVTIQEEGCFDATDGLCKPLTPDFTNLVRPPGAPDTIIISPTALQSTQVDTVFPTTLTATLVDNLGNPIPNKVLTFTAPTFTFVGGVADFASATFGAVGTNTTVITSTTGANGSTPAIQVRANNLAGNYNITVSFTPQVAGRPVDQLYSLQNLPQGAPQLQISGGDGQTQKTRSQFTTSLLVRAVGNNSLPISNTVVTFDATVNGAYRGTFNSLIGPRTTTVTTDVNGFAQINYFAGCDILPAGVYPIQVSAAGFASNIFQLTNIVGDPALFVAGANPASVNVEQQFANLTGTVFDSCQNLPTVADRRNNSIVGATVTFTAPTVSNPGSKGSPGLANGIPPNAVSGTFGTVNTNITTFNATSDAAGAVTATLIANGASNIPGGSYPITVGITKGGSPTVTSTPFNLTNHPGTPNSIINIAPAPPTDSATAGTAFATPFQVRVKDIWGNLEWNDVSVDFNSPNFTVGTLTVPSGTFGATGTNVTTANMAIGTGALLGIATAPTFIANCSATGVNNTSNPAPGAANPANYPVNATVTGVGAPVTYTLTNNKGAASTLTTTTLTPNTLSQTATVATAYTQQLKARVTDVCGNSIPNVAVTFTVPNFTTGTPDSTASGTFGATGLTTFTVLNTNPQGEATSAVLNANNKANDPSAVGTTNFKANVSSGALPALTGAFTFINNPDLPVNITTVGTLTGSSSVDNSLGTQAFQDVAGNLQLKALVTDQFTNPVPGVTVTFTAPNFTGGTPANASSATFGSAGGTNNTGNNNTATTTILGASQRGVASSPLVFPNNRLGGPYKVVASFNAGSVSTAPAGYDLTNTIGVTGRIVTAIAGDNQTGVNGQPVATAPSPFAVQLKANVKDQFNNPVNGATVSFVAPTLAPSGRFGGSTSTTATTDALGNTTGVTISPFCGTAGTFNVSVSVATPGATPDTFTLQSLRGTVPGGIAFTVVGAQSATVNTGFGVGGYTATVQDQCGNAVNNTGLTVRFSVPNFTTGTPASVPSGAFNVGGTNNSIDIAVTAAGTANSGQLFANNRRTDAVNPAYNMTVLVLGFPVLTTNSSFNFTNTPGVANKVAIISGNNQSRQVAPVGATAFAGLVVDVRDQFNNLVNAGVTVNFTAPAAIAAPTGTFPGGATDTATTGANGQATAPTFTPFCGNSGLISGGGGVVASVPGGSVTFNNLTAATGVANNLVVNAGNNQTRAAGVAYGAFSVTVEDGCTNTVTSAVSVTFTAPGAAPNGTFPGPSATSTVAAAAGIATAGTLTAGCTAGNFTVTASSAGLTSTNFTFTVTGVPTLTLVNSGNNQRGAGNSPFPIPLSVVLKDACGITAPDGQTVTFTSSSINSGKFGASATTTANTAGGAGVATAPTMTAGTTTGAFTVTASFPTATSVIFSENVDNVPTAVVPDANGLTRFIGVAGGTVSPGLGVRVTPNTPSGSAQVNWTVIAGTANGNFGGSATAVSFTDPDTGLAAPPVNLTALLGNTGNTFTVTAAVPGIATPVTFTIELAPSSMAVDANGLTRNSPAAGGAATAPVLGVVVSPNGAGGSPVTITWTVVGGLANGNFGGSASVTSNTNGTTGAATAPALMGAVAAAGTTFTVTATVQGAAGTITVTFTITRV